MGYFWRIAKANPYHDELGRFTTAEDAVMFVRPASGYNDGKLTPDENWRGAYKDGERFKPRRMDLIPVSRGGPDPVLDAPREPIQHQLPLPEVPAAIPAAAIAGAAIAGVSPSSNFPTAASAIKEVVDKASTDSDERAKWTFGQVVNQKLREAGYSSESNGKAGINSFNLVIETPAGEKMMLKRIDDDTGIGADGEVAGSALISQLGIDVPNRGVYAFEINGEKYALSEWVQGKSVVTAGFSTTLQAIEKTGVDSIAKLAIAEYLAGDSDRHYGNYMITSEGKISPIDYGRIGDYDGARGPGFQSTVANVAARGDLSFNASGMRDFVLKAGAVVEREVLPKIKDLYEREAATSVFNSRLSNLSKLFSDKTMADLRANRGWLDRTNANSFNFEWLTKAMQSNSMSQKLWDQHKPGYPFIL